MCGRILCLDHMHSSSEASIYEYLNQGCSILPNGDGRSSCCGLNQLVPITYQLDAAVGCKTTELQFWRLSNTDLLCKKSQFRVCHRHWSSATAVFLDGSP